MRFRAHNCETIWRSMTVQIWRFTFQFKCQNSDEYNRWISTVGEKLEYLEACVFTGVTLLLHHDYSFINREGGSSLKVVSLDSQSGDIYTSLPPLESKITSNSLSDVLILFHVSSDDRAENIPLRSEWSQ